MHSRQKMWAVAGQAHARGEREGRRQRLQEESGRKDVRLRRVVWEPHVDLRRERSWEVKNASEVLRLPEGNRGSVMGGGSGEKEAGGREKILVERESDQFKTMRRGLTVRHGVG